MMKAKIYILTLIITSMLVGIVFAATYSGDGTYTLSENERIVSSNGWQFEVTGIFKAYNVDKVNYQLYDDTGVLITSGSLSGADGEQKLGTSSRLKLAVTLNSVSGSASPTGSPMVTKYENAELSVMSIDEALPGTIEAPEITEEVSKQLAYSNGRQETLSPGDSVTLGNGYKLKFERVANTAGGGAPLFSLYSEGGNLIDTEMIFSTPFNRDTASEVGTFVGSYFHVISYDGASATLLVEDASEIWFGTGWNLFSIPIEDGDGYGTILESTCNEAVVWLWDNNANEYRPVGRLREGERLPAYAGLFVYTKTQKNVISDLDCKILVSGKKSVTLNGLNLKRGWNAIGAPMTAYGQREVFDTGSNFNMLDFNEVKGTCNIEKGPWQYLGTSLSRMIQDPSEVSKFTKPFNNKLRLNRGYFIKVADDCTLSDRVI